MMQILPQPQEPASGPSDFPNERNAGRVFRSEREYAICAHKEESRPKYDVRSNFSAAALYCAL